MSPQSFNKVFIYINMLAVAHRSAADIAIPVLVVISVCRAGVFFEANVTFVVRVFVHMLLAGNCN